MSIKNVFLNKGRFFNDIYISEHVIYSQNINFIFKPKTFKIWFGSGKNQKRLSLSGGIFMSNKVWPILKT